MTPEQREKYIEKNGGNPIKTLAQMKSRYVCEIFRMCNQNRSHTQELLGLPYPKLRVWIVKHWIDYFTCRCDPPWPNTNPNITDPSSDIKT